MRDIRIEAVSNGFVVRYDSPSITENNRKKNTQWEDPEVKVVFQDVAGLVAGIEKIVPNLTTASPEEEFGDTLSIALDSAE